MIFEKSRREFRMSQGVRAMAATTIVMVLVQFGGAAQAADAPGATDDPLGRVRIPLAENSASEAQLPSMYGTFNPEDAAHNAAMESLKLDQIEATASPLVIPAAGFTDDGFNPESMFFPFSGGYFAGDADAYGCMVAPAYLPAGAVVIDMFATVYDDDATFNITVNLRRVDNFSGGTDTMAAAATSGSFAGVTTVADGTIDFPTVVYPDYSYYVTTCVQSGSSRLYSVRLYFQ
jgi:hypothetical protein